jgi:hypothetical protein
MGLFPGPDTLRSMIVFYLLGSRLREIEPLGEVRHSSLDTNEHRCLNLWICRAG